MKTSVGTVLAVLIVLAVAALEYWQYKDAQAQRAMVNAQLVQLSIRIDELDQKLLATKREMQELESSSLGGIIDNANEALIQGWSVMVETVEQELARARESLQKRQSSDGGAPPNASPSSTNPPSDDGSTAAP